MDWSQFTQRILDSIKKAFTTDIANVKIAATQAAQDFLDQNKGDVLKWTQQCESGELSASDLQILLAGKQDLLKIVALKQVVLDKVALNKFITECTGILFQAISSLIP